MDRKKKAIQSMVAVSLSLVMSCSVMTAALAEEPEETVTTSTTSATSTTSTTAAAESSTETTTSTTEATSVSPTEEETTTTTTTTEPTTKPEPQPDVPNGYTGIAKITYNGVYGWWRVVNGFVQPKATGVFKNENGWWYVKNGMVDFQHNGVEKNENGWWRIQNGMVDFHANSIYKNQNGWWKCKNGKVDFTATGVYKNENGWWRVVKGKVDFNANGVFRNENGLWYVKKGYVDFSKTGTVSFGKATYTVQKGRVTGTSVKVPLVNQLPNYPTGCEAASATMLLKFYGYNISLKQMVAAIPRENLRTVNGKKYGPRITEKFVGDPTGTYTSKNPGYGAFAPVVTKSLNTVISNQHGKHKAVNKTGATFTELLGYLDAGKPVIVWSTYNLKTPTTVNAWYISTSTGPEYFSYPRGTHVCVLVGYDQKNVYLADPYGAKTKTFSRSAFNDKYKLLGRQAIILQ